ncbi:MAG: cupin domain-containing protein [Gammaproteobacteria bacterium]|nr:cupin domain-containing protein [Gammaproteobacteria bacterium]
MKRRDLLKGGAAVAAAAAPGAPAMAGESIGVAGGESLAFDTRALPAEADVTAPDGSEVRVLLSLSTGSAAHFRLAPGEVSRAGRHRTVQEIWYVLAGRGEMWRQDGLREAVAALEPGVCLTIPVGTSFQFRATGEDPLSAFAVTMPPWPTGSDDEWVEVAPRWPVRVGGMAV